ncbi:MAG TPA: GAF domain-containing protein, partial [Acidobacteriota bacterium]|nr:GAF domain-containing protein [Acidobacteriota bacterium]
MFSGDHGCSHTIKSGEAAFVPGCTCLLIALPMASLERTNTSPPDGAALRAARGDHDHELAAANRLITAIQELSLARDLSAVMQIVRRAARELTGADGATFVLRDGTQCYYADEDAISPLWKGNRFPMATCISGWVMMNRTAAVIPDIFQDPRIPVEAYRPTFVKSLAMVPIREKAPIAAIGNYWARPHQASARELWLLQALANSTSVAMENIEVCADLERRVRHRTEQLEAANRELEETNRELEAFAHSAS